MLGDARSEGSLDQPGSQDEERFVPALVWAVRARYTYSLREPESRAVVPPGRAPMDASLQLDKSV